MPTGNPSRRGHWRAVAAVVAGAGIALAACHQPPPPAPSNVTPEKALASSLRLTAAGDFDALMRNRLPPAEYAQWRAEWDKARANRLPPTLAQQQQFAKIMQMLTEPEAEAKLAARLKPELARLHGGAHAGLPIMAGIVQASGKAMIDASPQLAPAQRRLTTQGLDALIEWAKTTDFSDDKKAKKAIAIVCNTARSLHVQTLAQWRALDYASTMQDYGRVWNGLEKVLAVYGLDVAGSVANAKVATVAVDGDHATVKLALALAGQTLVAEWAMQEQGGHWYDTALLDAWRAAHPARTVTVPVPAIAAPPTAPPAHAGTASG